MTLFLILLLVALFVATDIIFFRWWIRRLGQEAVAALHEAVGDEKVYHVEDCNCFGVLSSGYAQIRGNGMIALTDKGIHFRMLIPRKYLFIPFDKVIGISNPRSFLGKTKARVLLRVDFINHRGEDDACAWLVPSLQWWGEAIEALRARKQPPPAPWKR